MAIRELPLWPKSRLSRMKSAEPSARACSPRATPQCTCLWCHAPGPPVMPEQLEGVPNAPQCQAPPKKSPRPCRPLAPPGGGPPWSVTGSHSRRPFGPRPPQPLPAGSAPRSPTPGPVLSDREKWAHFTLSCPFGVCCVTVPFCR